MTIAFYFFALILVIRLIVWLTSPSTIKQNTLGYYFEFCRKEFGISAPATLYLLSRVREAPKGMNEPTIIPEIETIKLLKELNNT